MNLVTFRLSNQILIISAGFDSLITLIILAANQHKAKLAPLIVKILLNLILMIVNYKYLIPNPKKNYLCFFVYLFETISVTLLNAFCYDSKEMLFISGMQRTFLLMIILQNIWSIKLKIYALLVENLFTIAIMLFLINQDNLLITSISLISGTFLLLILCSYVYLHNKFTIENEAKQFYEQKKREIEAANKARSFVELEKIQNQPFQIQAEINKADINKIDYSRVKDYDIAPLSPQVQQEEHLIRILPSNLSQERIEMKFSGHYEEAKMQEETGQPKNKFSIKKANSLNDQTLAVLLKHTQEGICSFNQKFEITFFNHFLCVMMGVKDENKRQLKEELFKIKTVQILQDSKISSISFTSVEKIHPNSAYSIPFGQNNNDLMDFNNIVRMSQQHLREQRSININDSSQSNLLGTSIREKLEEFKRKDFLKNFPKSNSMQLSMEIPLDLFQLSQMKKSCEFNEESYIKQKSGNQYTQQDFRKRSSDFFSYSFFKSQSIKNTVKFADNNDHLKQTYFSQNDISLYSIVDCLLTQIHMKVQKYEENQLLQSIHRPQKLLDFTLVATFTKDQQVFEIKFISAYHGSEPLLFLIVTDITDNYLYKYAFKQAETVNWLNKYHSESLMGFISGVMPLVELAQRQTLFENCQKILEKTQSFYNLYSLSFLEVRFVNYKPIEINEENLVQVVLVDQFRQLLNDIENFQLNPPKETKYIVQDPQNLRLIMWNIIQIFSRIFEQATVEINIISTDQKNLTLIKIVGKGDISDSKIIDNIKNFTLQSPHSMVRGYFLKKSKLEFLINTCQILSLELSEYKEDLKIRPILKNDKSSSQIELLFYVHDHEENITSNLSLIESSNKNINSYEFQMKFQPKPKFIRRYNEQIFNSTFQKEKILIHDQNGFERIAISHQLEFIKVPHVFVNNTVNLMKEIRQGIQEYESNPFILVIIVVDPFEDVSYKELTLDLKFHFGVRTLGLFSSKQDRDGFDNLGFDEGIEKPLMINDLYRIWSESIEKKKN